jgi:glycerol-3-phosphate acyltransferase PlsY
VGNALPIAVACLAVAYLFGGIPFELIVGKVAYRTDIREHGSGNLGATNTFRVLGTVPGVIVLLLDAAKGAAAVLIAAWLMRTTAAAASVPQSWFLLLVMFAAMAGHTYSPYLRFSGGKGVATAAGALLVLMPLVVLVLLVVLVVVIALSRMVSLGSVVVALLFPLLAYAFYSTDPVSVALTVLAAALVVFRHRSNISRIMQGKEAKIGRHSS